MLLSTEVTVVESGYRVSLTYNLYVCDATKQQGTQSVLSDSAMLNELKLKQALVGLAQRNDVSAQGRYYRFPSSQVSCFQVSKAYSAVSIQRSGVSVHLWDLIWNQKYSIGSQVENSRPWSIILLKWILSNSAVIKYRGLKGNGGGEFEIDFNSYFGTSTYRSQEVWWLTKRTELTRDRLDFVAYGNRLSWLTRMETSFWLPVWVNMEIARLKLRVELKSDDVFEHWIDWIVHRKRHCTNSETEWKLASFLVFYFIRILHIRVCLHTIRVLHPSTKLRPVCLDRMIAVSVELSY